ncbi:MAG: BlaI/MecI/CopY family transcriptional regulator [Lachnospiraceae bacterium]
MELTMSERDIMKCLWMTNKPMSVQELYEMLSDKFGRAWTYKTVASFLLVMRKKEYVKFEKVKRQYLYSPLITEKEYQENRIRYMRDYWFNGSVYDMLVSCADEDIVDEESMKRFKAFLNAEENN